MPVKLNSEPSAGQILEQAQMRIRYNKEIAEGNDVRVSYRLMWEEEDKRVEGMIEDRERES